MKKPRTAAAHDFPSQTCKLRDAAMFRVFSDEEFSDLAKHVGQVKLPPRGIVFYEGDENTYLFNVINGAVRLSKHLSNGRRQITGFAFPGDFLGLPIASDKYVFTAETVKETWLCRFKRADLSELLDRFPKLQQTLLDFASNEFAETQNHLVLLGQKSALERLASTLLHLSSRIGKHNEGTIVELPMTRSDLADYIGLTIETVSRNFAELRNAGVIAIPDRRTVVIHDAQELARLAGD